MTTVRAKSMLREPLRDGIDRRIEWKPTAADRKTNPALPPDACIKGRLIVTQVQPSDGSAAFLLSLFISIVTHRGYPFARSRQRILAFAGQPHHA